MSPITYPTITLSGVPFVFKVSLLSMIKLAEYGIDTSNPPEIITLPDGTATPKDPIASLRYVAGQAAACACVTGPDGKLHHAGLSPDDMASMIDIEDFAAVTEAVTEAVVKALRAAKSPASGTPAQ